jgi:hypothetical protein
MPLPGGLKVGDATSTKKQIFKVKQAEKLPSKDLPAVKQAIKGAEILKAE